MAIDYAFRTVDSERELARVVAFLREQDLGYPGYHDWVDRAHHELSLGVKTAIAAYAEGRVVADLVYQPHKELPRVREIKNLRVHPRVRRRDFAHFLIRQAEMEDAEAYDALLCDARSDQHGVLRLLRFSGFTPIAQARLYDDTLDIILAKPLRRSETPAGVVHWAGGLS